MTAQEEFAQAKKDAAKQAKKELGSANRGGFSSVLQARKQNMGDKAYKAATGQDRQHRSIGEDGLKDAIAGSLHLGQDFTDEKGRNRKATMDDIKHQAERNILGHETEPPR